MASACCSARTPHLQQLLDRLLPGLVGLEERVVLERVFRAFDVDIEQRVGGQIVIDDVLGRDAEIVCLGDAEELGDVSGVARTDLQGAVDVGDPVGIAVDERVDGDLALIRELSNESARGAGRDAGHRNQDAIRRLPELVTLQSLKHTTGFNCENEFCVGLEREMFDVRGDRIRARSKTRAIDSFYRAGFAIRVQNDELPRYGAAVFIGDESQLFARGAAKREERLDVVHDRVGLGLFVELGFAPVLALVVGVSLGRKVVAFDQFFRQPHHAERLGEALHRVHGKGTGLLLFPNFEIAALD